MIHVINYCEKVKEVSSAFENDFEKYIDENNYKFRDLCSFYILQIGEIVGRLSDDFRKKYNDINWINIKGIRNVIVHSYGKIEFDTMWDVITKDIEELNVYCRKILETEGLNYKVKL